MSDFILQAISADGNIRITAAQTTGIAERARNIHRLLPLGSAALGRTLTACAIMGNDIKAEEGSLTLQVRGDGPLGAITAVSDSAGNVRGYLQNPAVDLPLRSDGKLDVGGGVGEGILTVIKDFGGNEPFSGKVELQTGEIAEDISAYYVISEQVPTACNLGVLVDTDQHVIAAGGYIIWLLPSAPDTVIDEVERCIASSGSITTALKTADIEQVIFDTFSTLGLKLLDRHEISYVCKCSETKVMSALASLGKAELRRIIEEDGAAEVTCQFCDNIYTLDKSQLEELLNIAQ